MASFLKAIKDAIIVDDSKTALPSTKNAPPPMPAVQPAAGTMGYSQAVQATQTVDSVLDTDAVEAQIEGVIQGQTDFAQFAAFMKAVENLTSVIPDEGTRFRAAAATTGLTRDSLLASIKVYEAVLAGEQTNFEQTFVAQSESNIAQLNSQSESLVAEIQALTEQLSAKSNEKTELTKTITSKGAELAKAKIDFSAVTATIGNRYKEATVKLQQYLGA